MPEIIDIAVDFVDVKLDYLAALDGSLGLDLSGERHAVAPLLGDPAIDDSWYGGSPNQTREWIKCGYNVPASGNIHAVSSAPRKRTRWREEGDTLDIGRAWSGDPTPFSTRESGIKQGIRIEAEMLFSANVDSSVIADYGHWLAELASRYAANGHDLEINAVFSSSRLWRNKPQDCRYRIQLKRFGQQTDYVAWSPLFAPTGFRHLVFSMWSIDAKRRGWRTTVSLGRMIDGTHAKWDVSFDAATNTLKIGNKYGHAGPFPRELLERLLAKCDV